MSSDELSASSLKRQIDAAFIGSGLSPFPLVEVRWLDARSSALEWADDVGNEAMQSLACGYLVKQDVTALTIVQMLNETHVGHALTIPSGCVLQVHYLVQGE